MMCYIAFGLVSSREKSMCVWCQASENIIEWSRLQTEAASAQLNGLYINVRYTHTSTALKCRMCAQRSILNVIHSLYTCLLRCQHFSSSPILPLAVYEVYLNSHAYAHDSYNSFGGVSLLYKRYWRFILCARRLWMCVFFLFFFFCFFLSFAFRLWFVWMMTMFGFLNANFVCLFASVFGSDQCTITHGTRYERLWDGGISIRCVFSCSINK